MKVDRESGAIQNICPRSGIPTNQACEGQACNGCGWNPEVERERRKQIRALAAKKQVKSWGKKTGQAKVTLIECAPDVEIPALRLKILLDRINIENIQIFLWSKDGNCIYSGKSEDTAREYGELPVRYWETNGEWLRIDV